jgi:predicted phosphodiesterase
MLKRLHVFDCDVIAFGQKHRTMMHLEQRPCLLDPGSVGQARDLKAVACALIVDTETLTVEKIGRPFDPAVVIRLAKANGAGEWVNKYLL